MRLPLQLLAFPLAALALAALAQPFRPAERRLPWRAPGTEAPKPTPNPSPTPAPGPVAPAPGPVPAPRSETAAKAPSRPAPESAPQPVPYPAEAERMALLGRFPPLAEGSWAEVDGEAALWLHAHGAVFLDARRSAAFRAGHVKGARSLPAWEDGLAQRVQLLAMLAPDPKLPFVVYCSGGECRDSHLVAEALRAEGFVNLRIYREGWPDWVARGGAVDGAADGGRP